MTDLATCAMCQKDRKLQKSHIFPRSYFKALKDGDGQLVSVDANGDGSFKVCNSDPKEKLLCWDCEQFLSDKFEKYGVRLLKDKKKVKRNKNVVVINNFRYKEFYLYLVSILWRVSITSINRYEHITLGTELNSLICQLLRNNKLKISTSFRLDHFIKISLFKIVDQQGKIADHVIRKTFVDMAFERGKESKDGMVFYFMIDGFLITYHFHVVHDIHDIRTLKNYAQLSNKQTVLVPVHDICDFKQIADGFNTLITQPSTNSKNN